MNESVENEFLEAYDSLAEPLFRHCYFRVYSKEKAEDLVSETFFKTWQYLIQGKEVENLKAFLYRVANNLVIDYSRKKKEDSLESILANSPQFEPSFDGREKTEHTMAVKEVFAVIDKLPDDMRQLLLLRYAEDLDPKEIADILGITANNVSVRLNRAHAMLKKVLDSKKTL